MNFEEWLNFIHDISSLTEVEIENMRAAWNAAINEAAKTANYSGYLADEIKELKQ